MMKFCTERGVLSVSRFCYVFPCELQGPAWAVGSYSISQSAGETSQNIIFKTLRQIGRPAIHETCWTSTQLLSHYRVTLVVEYLGLLT